MKTKLCNLVEIFNNDLDSITFKVKPNTHEDLIKLGFSPQLTHIYLSKGENHVMKFSFSDDKPISFDFGANGYTVISEDLRQSKNKVLECIDDYGVLYMGENKNAFKKTSNILTLEDKYRMEFDVCLLWNDNDRVTMRIDDNFYKRFSSIEKARNFIDARYNIIKENEQTKSQQTNCNILTFTASYKNDLEKNKDSVKEESYDEYEKD